MAKKTIKEPCQKCNGSGKRRNKYGTRIKCDACYGRGTQKRTVTTDTCPHCGGKI